MKRAIVSVFLVMLMSTGTFAAEFAPTMLKIQADPIIGYDFNGYELGIPVTVEGTAAGLIFSVFTKGKANEIGTVQNGYLGWHWVNKIDTCIYYSALKNLDPGNNIITWDGKDQDGGYVPPNEYTYYIWAYDNQGSKQQMSKHMPSGWGFDYQTGIQEVDESGIPLANPIWYHREAGYVTCVASRWIIGSDPYDETLKITSTFSIIEGWEFRNEPLLDPGDFDMWYNSVGNVEQKKGSIQKFRFVPGGEAVLQTDWGEENGYATIFDTNGGGSPGVATDGNYLFAGDENHVASTDPDSDFYIYDFDGYMVAEVDLSPWWSNPADLVAGGQMNGGPINFYGRDGKIYLNCHCNCLNQMVDPARYLETEEYDDFFVWSNGNGDYTLDHNFEETAQLKWICNDYNVGPYKYSISADANGFTAANAYDVGAVSFGLLAPDGSGLGYYAFAGETNGWKKGTLFLDGDTPYDGIYCDNEQTMGPHYDRNNDLLEPGIFFIGHDSIKGVITATGSSLYLLATSPSGGERIMRGTDYTIAWYSNDVASITIEFSHDGGASWMTIAENVDAALKKYVWRVPGTVSDNCLLRLKADDHSSLVYVTKTPFSILRPANTTEYYLPDVTDTGSNATILVNADSPPHIDGNPINYDDNIGVFTPRGLCAGAAIWDGVNLAITVWGDDPMTDGTRGFLPGEPFTFKLWNAAEDKEYIVHPTFSRGENRYASDGLYILASLENKSVSFSQSFAKGWNYFSVPLRLSDYSLTSVFSGIDSHVVVMKNGAGEVYWPDYGINAIGYLDIAEGYQLYTDATCTLSLDGYELFPPDVVIELREGWNLIGCTAPDGMSVEAAFASIADDVIIIKNGHGEVYWPDYGIDDIGVLAHGEAYWVNVGKACDFRYPAAALKPAAALSQTPEPLHFQLIGNTGANATLLIPGGCVRVTGCSVGENDEIGVFTADGLCVGAARINTSGNTAVTLWGNNSVTEQVDGLVSGEAFRLVFWDRESSTEYNVTVSSASMTVYEPNGLLIASGLVAESGNTRHDDSPAAFTLSQNSPNPFNPTTSIPFTLPKEGRVTLTVYDITGRTVATLADGAFAAGSHEVVWDATGMASGVYICRLEAAGMVKTLKMTLTK